MVDQSSAVPVDPRIPILSFGTQLSLMVRAFWMSPVRRRVLLLSGALLAIILGTVYVQLLLNRWNVPFYNALERRSLPDFLHQLQIFFLIAGALLVLNVCQAWLNQMFALSLRAGITNDLVDHWLRRKRAIRLSSSSPLGINPDQRLHEDARNLSDMTTSLSIGMVQATILLISFVGVLWTTSSDLTIPIAGRDITIPGYMVWAAVLYAGLASVLTSLVGQQLVGLNADRSAREADLRAILVRTSQTLGVISIADGQERERGRIGSRITDLLSVFRDLAWAQTRLTWVSAGFGWLAQIVPLVVAAPAYFSGALSFGGLMMAAGAFSQVNIALQWYVTNFGMISNWRATLLRISTFRQALSEMDKPQAGLPMIHYEIGRDSSLRLGDLSIAVNAQTPDGGAVRLTGLDEPVRPGDRVMIVPEAPVDHQLLFHALAGDWPWGTGSIAYPSGRDVSFVPKAGQLPAGTLRELLTYPHPPAAFEEQDLVVALGTVGLTRLAGMLDTTPDWQHSLAREEQARLHLARVIVLRPGFVIFDDFLDGLDGKTRSDILQLLQDMPDRAMIYIGDAPAFREAFQPRLARLARTAA